MTGDPEVSGRWPQAALSPREGAWFDSRRMRLLTPARACALTLTALLATAAGAQQPDPSQQQQPPPPQQQWPPPQWQQPPPPPPPADTGQPQSPPQTPPDATQPQPPPPAPPPGDTVTTQPQPGLQEGGPENNEPEGPQVPPEALLDGHPRMGPFLAGPGSLTFITTNTILGGLGGFGTQFISAKYSFEQGKQSMLVGTLVGAGLGFGISTWWQFTHWMDRPVASFSLINGLYAGMLAGGLVDSLSPDVTALAYASFISAEIGAWLTASVGGGEMKLADGLAMASAGAWAGMYTGLVLATLANSGGTPPTSKGWVDALLIAPGLGAGAMACALLQIHPTANQVIRGDLFGLGVGTAVLLASGFIVGFNNATTYILTLLTSAGALAAVSVFWEEAAERPPAEPYQSRKRPYNNPFW
jgi:hypothetical protein